MSDQDVEEEDSIEAQREEDEETQNALKLVHQERHIPSSLYESSRICLALVHSSRGASEAKSMRWWEILWIVAKIAFRLRPGLMLLMLVIAILSSVCDVASPKAFQIVVDAFTSSKVEESKLDTGWLMIYVLIFALSNGFAEIFKALTIRLSVFVALWLEDVWAIAALKHVMTLPLSFHHKNDSGALSSKIERGAGEVCKIAMGLLGDDVLLASVGLISSLSVAIQAYTDAAWIFLVPIPLYILASHLFERKWQKSWDEFRPLRELADAARSDALRNVLSVKLFGSESTETGNIAHIFSVMRRKDVQGDAFYFGKRTAEEIVKMCSRAALLLFCLPRLQSGEMTMGQMTLLVSLQTVAFQPLQRVSSVIVDTTTALKKLKPLISLMREPDGLADRPDAVDLPRLSKGIVLKNVDFSYNNRMALRGINLVIRPGTTALVGPSGAGKSTLVNLLLRFYDPDSGAIYWDDIDYKQSTRSSRHKHISVVPQDASLFNRSIRENIAFGRPECSEEEVIEAAKIASAHTFITKVLPKGYDTMVGERGVLLSGGQRQRLAIARAVLMRPSVLILDESTSSLDSESEYEIQKALDRIEVPLKIVIAHRLATVINADQIIVVDGGAVVASGTHAELLQSCDLYKRLCELQFGTSPSSSSSS